jgi:hypothetical protein
MPRKKKTITMQHTIPAGEAQHNAPLKLDAKFYAAVHKVKDGKSVPDDEWVIFLAKDNAFPATLQFYLEECVRLGADEEHCESVQRMIRRLEQWRQANPDRCKVPDARGEKLLG